MDSKSLPSAATSTARPLTDEQLKVAQTARSLNGKDGVDELCAREGIRGGKKHETIGVWRYLNINNQGGPTMKTAMSFMLAVLCGIAFSISSTGCGGSHHRTVAPAVKSDREFSSKQDGDKWVSAFSIPESVFTNPPEVEEFTSGSVSTNGGGGGSNNNFVTIMPRKTVIAQVKDLATGTIKDYSLLGKNENGLVSYDLPIEFESWQAKVSDRGFAADMSKSAYYVVDPDGFTLKGQAAYGTIRPYQQMKIPGFPGYGVDKKVRNDIGSFELYLNVEGLQGELQMPKLTDIGSSPFPISDTDGDGYVFAEDADLPDGQYFTIVWVVKDGAVIGRMNVSGSAYEYDHPKYGKVIGFVKEGGSIRPILDVSVIKPKDSALIPGPEVVVQFPKTKTIPYTFSGMWSNGFWQDLTFAGAPYVTETPVGNATVEWGEGVLKVEKVDGSGEDVTVSKGWDSLPAKSIVVKVTPNLQKIEFTERSYQLFNSTPAVTKDTKVRKTFVNGFSDESKAGVKFRMEDPTIATVGETDGAITPVGLGESKMDCYTENDEFVDTVIVTVIKELDHHETQGDDMTLLSGVKRKMVTRAFYKDKTDELRSDIKLKFTNPNAASSENNDNELTAKEGETDVITLLNGVESTNKKKLTVLGKTSGPVTGLEIEPASSPDNRVKVASGKSLTYKVFELHGTVRGDDVTKILKPNPVLTTPNSSETPGTVNTGDMGKIDIELKEGSLPTVTLYIEVTDAVKSVILNGGRELELALGETKEISGTIELGSSPSSNDLSTLTFNPALPGNENVELALSADKTKLSVKGLTAGEYTLTGSIDGVAGSIKIKIKATPKVVRVLDASGQPFVDNTITMKLGFPGASPTAKIVRTVDLKGTEEVKDVTLVANWALNAPDGSSKLTDNKPPFEAVKGGSGILIVTFDGVSSIPMTVKVEAPKDLIVLDASGQPFADNTMNLFVDGPEGEYTLYFKGYTDGSRLVATDLGVGSPSSELFVTLPVRGKVKPSTTVSSSGTIQWGAILGEGSWYTDPLKVVVSPKHLRYEVDPTALSLATGGVAGSYKVYDVQNNGSRLDVTATLAGTKVITTAVPSGSDPFSVPSSGSVVPASNASGGGTLTFGEATLTITVSAGHLRYEVDPTALSLATGGVAGSYKVYDVQNNGSRLDVTATLAGTKVITTAVPSGSDPFSVPSSGSVVPASNASGGGTLTFGEATLTITVAAAPNGLIVTDVDGNAFTNNTMVLNVAGEDVNHKLFLTYNNGTRDEMNNLDGNVLSGPVSLPARGKVRPSGNTCGTGQVAWSTTVGSTIFTATANVVVDIPSGIDQVVRFLKPTVGGNNASVSISSPAKNEAPDAIVTALDGRRWYKKTVVFPSYSMVVFMAEDMISGDKSAPFFYYQVCAANRVNLNFGGNFPGSWGSIGGSTYFATNANGESDIVLEFDFQTLAVTKGNR